MDATKLDQTGDRNYADFHRYARLYPLPDYVKQAATSDVFAPGELPVNAYADVREPRQFPGHTKLATYVSYIYFLEKQSQLHPKIAVKIQERLDKFAMAWGLVGEIDQLKAKHATLHSGDMGELPDHAFAYVWATDDGKKDRRYPLRNALEVKAAADWFNEYRDQFSFNDRHVIATKILEKAAKFGARLTPHEDMLDRQAGRGFCDPKQAAQMIRQRVRAVDTIPELKEGFSKLAQMVENAPQLAVNNGELLRLAEAVDTFDRIAHVKYSSVTPRVEDVLFAVTYKEATDLVDTTCTMTTGTVYNLSQFEKLSVSDVRDLLGDDIADSVADGLRVSGAKMAEMAHTLPLPDAERLDQLMGEAGQAPVYKRASAHVGFSHQQLRGMAHS